MAGRLTLKTTGWLRKHLMKVLEYLKEQGEHLNTMFTELFTDTPIVVTIPLHASKTVYNVFYARRGYTVTGISYTPDIAQGGALTATVVKATGTATPAAATTPMHIAAAINLNGTAHTVQNITLTETAADLVLASGNRIGLVLSGAMTVGSGLLEIRMSKT